MLLALKMKWEQKTEGCWEMRSECFFSSVCLLSPHRRSAPWNWAKGFVYCLVRVLRICLSSCVFLIYKEFTVRLEDAFYFLIIFLFGLWEFQAYLQCIFIVLTFHNPISITSKILYHIPSQLHVLFLTTHWIQSVLPMCMYTQAVHWRMDNLPGTTSLRKSTLPSWVSSADNSSLGKGRASWIHVPCWNLVLILNKFSASNCSFREFTSTATLSCPKDLLQQLSSILGSHNLFTSPSSSFTGLGVI